MEGERRSNVQLVVSISSILSVIVASVSVLSFIQLAEKRITTMEVRLENLIEVVKENGRAFRESDSKMKR